VLPSWAVSPLPGWAPAEQAAISTAADAVAIDLRIIPLPKAVLSR
jgi:hypothetical protein